MRLVLSALYLWILAISSTSAQSIPYVILVSFDGFRYDYVERYDLPNFKKFIKKGSSATSLIPSFPSKTFPNHYTIVTGLYPGNHGLVDNQFYDSKRKQTYSMRNRQVVEDAYYYGGTPLWKLAKQNGIKSASYFWVGSEIPVDGEHPDYYYKYNGDIPFDDRVDKVIEWLNLPEKERPHFITLYFSSPDHEGHEFGPESEETRNAVLNADRLLEKLVKGVESTKLPVNIFLVSDHGMKELTVAKETFIFLDELMDTDHPGMQIEIGGTQVHFYLSNPDQADSLYNILKPQENHFTILKKSQYRPEWNYDHYRSGDLLLVADEGHYIHLKDRAEFIQREKQGAKFGVHGYDPFLVKDVHGIFYAQGPNIKPGTKVPSFQNIHIYPLIAKILMLPAPPVDGRIEVLDFIYRK